MLIEQKLLTNRQSPGSFSLVFGQGDELHADGFRSTVMCGAGTIVVSVEQDWKTVDSEVAIVLDEEMGELYVAAASYASQAICHAVNAGLSIEDLQSIVDSVRALNNRHYPFPYAGMRPVGMAICELPSLQYVLLNDNDPDNVVLVNPNVDTRLMGRHEFNKAYREQRE